MYTYQLQTTIYRSRKQYGARVCQVKAQLSPYSVLGLDSSANKSDIKEAYRRLARKYHPDVSQEPNAEQKFVEIQQSYAILTGKAVGRAMGGGLGVSPRMGSWEVHDWYWEFSRQQRNGSNSKQKPVGTAKSRQKVASQLHRMKQRAKFRKGKTLVQKQQNVPVSQQNTIYPRSEIHYKKKQASPEFKTMDVHPSENNLSEHRAGSQNFKNDQVAPLASSQNKLHSQSCIASSQNPSLMEAQSTSESPIVTISSNKVTLDLSPYLRMTIATPPSYFGRMWTSFRSTICSMTLRLIRAAELELRYTLRAPWRVGIQPERALLHWLDMWDLDECGYERTISSALQKFAGRVLEPLPLSATGATFGARHGGMPFTRPTAQKYCNIQQFSQAVSVTQPGVNVLPRKQAQGESPSIHTHDVARKQPADSMGEQSDLPDIDDESSSISQEASKYETDNAEAGRTAPRRLMPRGTDRSAIGGQLAGLKRRAIRKKS